MKKLMVTLLMLAAMSGYAMAQDFIGMFADMDGTTCDAAIQDYTEVVVYVMAYIPSLPDGITAAEFAIPDLPENEGYPTVQVLEDWGDALVIGDVRVDISLAFPDPIYGPFASLGSFRSLTSPTAPARTPSGP